MPAGMVVMRVGVRGGLVQWVDEKPWRFKLILLLHTAVVGAILLSLLNLAGSCFETNQSMATSEIGMAAVRSHSRLGMCGSARARSAEWIVA